MGVMKINQRNFLGVYSVIMVITGGSGDRITDFANKYATCEDENTEFGALMPIFGPVYVECMSMYAFSLAVPGINMCQLQCALERNNVTRDGVLNVKAAKNYFLKLSNFSQKKVFFNRFIQCGDGVVFTTANECDIMKKSYECVNIAWDEVCKGKAPSNSRLSPPKNYYELEAFE